MQSLFPSFSYLTRDPMGGLTVRDFLTFIYAFLDDTAGSITNYRCAMLDVTHYTTEQTF
jgi:hypothetical protein